MKFSFALLRRTAALLALVALAAGPAVAEPSPPATEANGAPAAGGKFRECHGYVRHVTDDNIKVHCIDGTPSDQSFLYVPRFSKLKDGTSIQAKELKPETPVHILYTQTLGVKKASRIEILDADGAVKATLKG